MGGPRGVIDWMRWCWCCAANYMCADGGHWTMGADSALAWTRMRDNIDEQYLSDVSDEK